MWFGSRPGSLSKRAGCPRRTRSVCPRTRQSAQRAENVLEESPSFGRGDPARRWSLVGRETGGDTGGTPKPFAVAMRRSTVQRRATTCRWAGPVASAGEPAIVVTLRSVGGGDEGPSASKVEGRGVESPRPLRMGRWASADQARSSARRRERREARRPGCKERRRRRRGPPGLAYPGVGRAREVRW